MRKTSIGAVVPAIALAVLVGSFSGGPASSTLLRAPYVPQRPPVNREPDSERWRKAEEKRARKQAAKKGARS